MVKTTQKIPLAELAPTANEVTPYDQQHLSLYMDLIEAIDAGALIDELCIEVLHIDPKQNRDRAVKCLESHILRARWCARQGLKGIVPAGPRPMKRLAWNTRRQASRLR